MYKGEERRSKDSKRDEFNFWGTKSKEVKEVRAIKRITGSLLAPPHSLYLNSMNKFIKHYDN